MNFTHTEDRRMLADSLNRFVAEQYGIEHRNQLAYGDEGHSPALYAQFAELGAIGDAAAATAAAAYFNYRKLSIFGGSNEIQKNIISKMILGL